MSTGTAPRIQRKAAALLLPFELKAVDAPDTGRTFEGFLSTSHLDLGDGWMRDVVRPGAFKRWLNNFKKAADPYVPLLDSHDRFSIFSSLGTMKDAEEQKTDETFVLELQGGATEEVPVQKLWTRWEVIEDSSGDGVLTRLRSKAVRQMSMGYNALREDFGTLASGERFRNLREVQVREGSLVVFAMQPNATVDASTVKYLEDFLTGAEGRELEDYERQYLTQVRSKVDKLLSTQAGQPAPDRPSADQLAALTKRVDSVLLGPLLGRISNLVGSNHANP